MRMLLSNDGRYYHGKSIKDGYVFIESTLIDRFYHTWADSHPTAPDLLKQAIVDLLGSADFWDMAMLEGAHVLQSYMRVDLLASHSYRVSCIDHGKLLWDYVLPEAQLLNWLPTISCLVQTTDDPLCGIYTPPKESLIPLWEVPSYALQ